MIRSVIRDLFEIEAEFEKWIEKSVAESAKLEYIESQLKIL